MLESTQKILGDHGTSSPVPDEWDDVQVLVHHDFVCDLDEVRRAVPILFGPGELHELRALPSGRGQVVTADDMDALCWSVEEVCDQQIYYSLNPIQAGTDRATKKTVTSRRWLLIDVDTIRPDKDQSATDVEKESGSQLVIAILDHLTASGWPAPLLIDSGNGWHLLYRIDIPNDSLSQQILKACLYALAEKFDCSGAIVDRATHDAARIAKLPGTWSRKGLSTSDRPHRLCRLVAGPESPQIVSVELLQALGTVPKQENGKSTDATWEVVVGHVKGLAGYVRSAIERECFKVAMTTEGDRNNALNRAAFSLGTMAGWVEMDEVEARATLLRSAERAGLPPRECLITIASGWESGRQQPRDRPADTTPSQNGKLQAGKFIIWASSIKPRKVEWLCPGRIPLGKMTTFAGQTGLGKTFTVCDLAARVTRGGEIPFGGGKCYPRGKVLIISAEDDADDTIVPRFMELGGDLSRLALLSPECEERFSLSALELLNGCISDMGSDVKMVAIDPPTSYLGRVDDHKNAELRGLLAPLRNWCRDRRIALIFVTHVNKPGANKLEALSRVMGSVAWVAAVRSAHMFCPDPANPARHLYLPLKVNNAKKRNGLAYEIVSTTGDLATLRWIEEVDITADEAMSAEPKKKSRATSAIEWLEERFREKRKWLSEDLRTEAMAYGLSKNALWEPAVQALPIHKKQEMTMDGRRCWFWVAEDGWPKPIPLT